MSKILGIAFSPTDADGIASFASAMGVEFEIIGFDGEKFSDNVASAIRENSSGFSHIISVSCMESKDILARAAGLLDAGMITDVVGIHSTTEFERPIYAGTIISIVKVLAEPVVLTFRPGGFEKVSFTGSIRQVSLGSSSVKSISKAAKSGARPDLTQAKVVVSGGRPLKEAAIFEAIIGGLADALGGAVGATRAAVDSGIAATELQVGQTGKIVSPDLYIAAGISGSTQHMAGIKDSKIIVAINKDGDAPIFEVADLGLVADLFVAIPEIRAKLGK